MKPTRVSETLGLAPGEDFRELRQRQQQRIRNGPVLPYGRGGEVQAKMRCEKCGAVVDSTLNGKCRNCLAGAGAQLSARERRELRSKLAELDDQLGVLSALVEMSHSTDEDIRRVPDRDVPTRAAHAANVATVVAANSLGVDVPLVAWFRGSDEFAGYAPNGENLVLFNADLSPIRLVNVAAHETAHVAGRGHPEANHFADRFAATHEGAILNG